MASQESTAQIGIDANLTKIFLRKSPESLSPAEVEAYRCFICRLLLRQPSQLSCCGRRSCRSCIDGKRRNRKIFHCPKCNEEIGDGGDERNYVFTDASCVNDMKNMETVCNTKPSPCKWRGKVSMLESHKEQCDNAVVSCGKCGDVMKRSQLSEHMRIDCRMREIGCSFCSTKIEVAMLQEHLVECTQRKDYSCPFCEENCKTREQLYSHVYDGHCKKAVLSCSMRKETGCLKQVKPSEITRHTIDHIKDENYKLKQVIIDLRSECNGFQQHGKRQEEHIGRLEQEIVLMQQEHKKQVSQQQAQMQNILANFEMISAKVSNIPSTQPPAMSSQNLSQVESTVRSLQHSYDSLSRQLQTITSKVEENSEQAGALQTGIDQCTTAINQVNGLLNEVGLKVDILAVRSINGILIWKVNEVEKRIEEARTGKILSLYSPPFFTSLHGYRMCLRLYLDGDGQGKGTHVSLFLVIMKSDYDDLLSWPFKQKVTLYLLNQQDPYNTRAHIAQAFRPTETSTSFQKPKGPFNTASGFPRFAPIAKLYDRSYVQDDCMYFKVKIDMTDLKAPDFPAY